LSTDILFIINPVSGGRKKEKFHLLAEQELRGSSFNTSFHYTHGPGDAHEQARAAAAAGIGVVVAVGGDGTINEVASALEGTSAKMGIIPCGSGNGLARSLGIPLNQAAALRRIGLLRSLTIDSGTLNGRKFFNMAGIGFDAHISMKFASLVSRGFSGYIHTAIREIRSYLPADYRIEIDGVSLERAAFMISIANSSQFGNNAHISPMASLTDGLLDVCIIRPFPAYKLPLMGYVLFSKTAHRSPYVEIIRGKRIRITRDRSEVVHLDGEPVFTRNEVDIRVKPLSLNILV
jgi:diacylglycerol kinase (ATP)